MMTTSAPAETPDRPVPGVDLPQRLRFVITRLARRMRQAADDGVSPTQIAALATINRDGPMTLGELAAAEQVQPPTITAAVGRLEAHGFVRRERDDPGDRRVVRVSVTPQGRKLVERMRSQRTAYLAKRLRDLPPRELETLADAAVILDRILAEDEKS
jgi:DNA-binding MarR family transcriptional regulator